MKLPLNVTTPNERIFFIVLGLLCVAFIGWMSFGVVTHTTLVQGVVASTAERRDVVAEVDGRLEEWLVKEDGRVATGTPLARLALPALEAHVNALRARIDGMAGSGSASGSGEKGAELADARTALLLLQSDLDGQSRVTSPGSGKLVDRRASPGDLVSRGDLIARVRTEGDGEYHAIAQVPAKIAERIKAGMDAVVTMQVGDHSARGFEAKVDKVTAPERGSAFHAHPGQTGGQAGGQDNTLFWVVRFSFDSSDSAMPEKLEGIPAQITIILGHNTPAGLFRFIFS